MKPLLAGYFNASPGWTGWAWGFCEALSCSYCSQGCSRRAGRCCQPHNPQTLAETTDGDICMATYEAGLFVWHSHQVTALRKGIPDKINCLLPIAGAQLWIGSDEGLALWNGHEISTRLPSSLFQGARILSLTQDQDGNLWIGTSNGLFRRNQFGLEMLEGGSEKTPRIITALFENREGNVWAGDQGGIERISDGVFKTYSLDSSVPTEGGSGPIYADRLGQVWIAPAHSGLYRISHGTIIAVGSGALMRDVIYSIAGSGDSMWVGRRNGGLTHLAPSMATRSGMREVKTYKRLQGLAQNSVSSVLCAADGTIWVGTLSGGASHLVNERFTTLTATDGLGSNTIYSIQQSPDGQLWFGTSDGLSNFSQGSLRNFRVRDGLPSNEVMTLFVDRTGVLWIGTSQGLAYLANGHITSVLDAQSAFREPIYGIGEDRAGHLWLTTSSHVYRANRDDILKGSVTDMEIRAFGEEDGLRGTEGVRRDRSVAADPAGHVWLSTTNGFSLVHERQENSLLAPAVVSIWSDGNEVRIFGPVNIGPAPQRIVVNYEAVSLEVPNRVQYRYKLAGFDRAWSAPTDVRQVVYTNLGPGRYQFGVLATDGTGGWKGSGEALSFVIIPTTQQTWWFRTLCVLTSAATLWGLYILRLNQATGRLKVQLDARLEERERLARDLHDTLLQGFQGVVLRFQGALKHLPEGAGKEAIEKTLDKADFVMIQARQSVKDLRGEESQDSFQSLLASCGEELAEGSSSLFRLVVLGTTRALHPPIVQESYRIIREALINAFQHSAGRHIEVELTYRNDRLSVAVRDDGAGMDETVSKRGRTGHWGIIGMRERAEKIGADLSISSRVGSGTEVSLVMAGQIAYLDSSVVRHRMRRGLKRVQPLLASKRSDETSGTLNATLIAFQTIHPQLYF